MSKLESTVHCVKCKKVLRNGIDARYNYPDGTRCIECGDGYKGWMKREKIRELKKLQNELSGVPIGKTEWKGITKIGKYQIPTHLLINWKDAVIHCRTASTIGMSRENPLFAFNSLQNRERLHREIFKHLELQYHADCSEGESIKLNNLLSEWLDDQCSGESAQA